MNKEDIKNIENDDNRFDAYEEYGYTKEALKDKFEEIRLHAYRALGYTKEAFKDEDPVIICGAYLYFGFTKEALKDESEFIRECAEEWFEECKELLELEEVIYKFTPEQATLLRLNGIKVNPRAINKTIKKVK